ncbi:thiamine pyrophosphate-binding protein [Streptomyces sp. YGL11-2]|uniref:thiamine pyrophosphate-binding protein n=1 Tax=Streptomyces sp. YGL11-2 TaxID=3414028 RepID=UPI003CF79C30
MSNAWNTVALTLAEAGCDLVVGVPSDEPGLLDTSVTGLRTLVVRDQRVGACLATGHAMVSGKPAVLALTSGPPFPNALAGLAEAASLCVPLVIVTTRIPTAGIGRGGFQETDQRSMASSLVKWHYVVESPEQLAWAVRRAVHLSVNGRPGLTVVEIADEVTRPAKAFTPSAQPPVTRLRSAPDPQAVHRAVTALRSAERPLVILGGGAKAAGAGEAALRLAETLDAVVMTTASGRGSVPESHPSVVGLVGLYTTPPLENLLAETDVVLAVGTRLEETVRMGWPDSRHIRLVHMDTDPYAFGQAFEPEVAVLGDAALTLKLLLDELRPAEPSLARADWRRRRTELDDEAFTLMHRTGSTGSLAREAVLTTGEVFGERTNYVHENGLHDIWSYHYPLLPIGTSTKVVMPGEQTMLGFGLPAAVGAGMARPDVPTVLLCGDGAMAMNVPALVTAAEHRIGLVVVMFDNSGFGWPRHLRVMAGEQDDLTRFAVSFPLDEMIRGLGGTVTDVTDPDQLCMVLAAAKETARTGATALVRVLVLDNDVPPGITRVLANLDGS